MLRAPASLCVIVKNNPQIGILLRLARDYFAEIVVVDTGSTDATVEICRTVADRVEVFTACNDAEGRIVDFSLARRRSFDLATQDVIAWADSDDELRCLDNIENEIEVLRALRKQLEKPTLLMFDYDYKANAAGVTERHNRERLLLREDWLAGAFAWKGRVHELLCPMGSEDSIARVRRPSMVWVHRQHAEGRESQRNLRILRLSIDEEGGLGNASLRTIYCYAGECISHRLFDDVRMACTAYLRRPGAGVERTLMYGYLAQVEQACGNHDIALQHALTAFSNAQGDTPGGIESRGLVADGAKDTCFMIGSIYRTMANGTEGIDRVRHANACAVRFFRMGLTLQEGVASASYPQTSLAARAGLIDALRALGKNDEALLATEDALAVAPGMPQFLKHRAELNIFTQKMQLVQSIGRLHEWEQLSNGDVDGLRAILNTAPNQTNQLAERHVGFDDPMEFAPTEPAPRPGKLDIILACGDTREIWNPDLVEAKGIGGSETAACDWARGMVARGHRVRVYTRCGEAKVYDGVEYLPTAALATKPLADVAIAWRSPRLLQHVRANVQLVWAHDTTVHGAWANQKVVALSEWHRKTLLEAHPMLDPQNVRVIPSAIRTKDFVGNVERRPHSAVCMSAHERHLLAFVDIWPRIRKEVPDATLDLFYGYDEWKKMGAASAEQIRYFDRKRPMLEAMGVTFHPRLPPKEVAAKMLSASVWLYPTNWPECWPAVAAQAQAAGLFSVTTDLAALPEMFSEGAVPEMRTARAKERRVGYADLLVGEGHYRGWNLEPDYQDAFVDRAVAALRYPLFDKARASLSHSASERFGWSRCLDAWEALLTEEHSHKGTEYESFVKASVQKIMTLPTVDFPLTTVLQLPDLEHSGLWLEFGVFKGRSLRMLAGARGDASVFGFDCFTGLPEDWRPGLPKGSFGLPCVPLPIPGASYVVGLFEDTLPTFEFTEPVTLVHIDCDIGSAAQTALKAVAPHLANVAYVVFDELWAYDGFEKHEMLALYDQLVTAGFEVEFLYKSAYEQVACRVTRTSPIHWAPKKTDYVREFAREQERIDTTYSMGFYRPNLMDRGAFQRFGKCIASVLPRGSSASVLDIGCGAGLLVADLRTRGYDARGFDGSKHAVESSDADLRSAGIVWQHSVAGDNREIKRHDYTVCTEVAEHLPAKHAKTLISLIDQTTRFRCLFSAAPVGQGGLDHINEQPPSYWLVPFAAHGLHVNVEETRKLREAMRASSCVHAVNDRNFFVLERRGKSKSLDGPMVVEHDAFRDQSRRKNLIVVNRGPGSPPMQRPSNASWDWIEVVWHKNSPRMHADKIIFDGDRDLRKFTTAYKIQEDLAHYGNIALLDDDILLVDHAWDDIFELFAQTKAGVGHPALTSDSETRWPILFQQHGIRWRETNFVEVQAPIFTQVSLQKYLPAFAEARFGCGLEDVWRDNEPFLAILDGTPVRHARPTGSADAQTGLSYKPDEEIARFRAEFGVHHVAPRTLVSHRNL